MDQRKRRGTQHFQFYPKEQGRQKLPAVRVQLHAGGTGRLPCGRTGEKIVPPDF